MDFGLGLVLSFTDNATAGINNAVNSLNQLTQTAESAGNSLNEIASLSAFSSIATSMGNSMTSAGTTILSTFSQIISKVNDTGQTLMYAENQLDKLYEGSSKTGKSVLNDLTEYAKKSIFEFEDLIPVVTMLKANGIEAFDAITSSSGKSSQTLMDYAADLAAFNPQMKNAYGTGIQAAMGALNEYIAEGNARSLKSGASLDITGLLGEDKGDTIEERSRQVADLLEQLNMVGMTAQLANTPMTKLSNMSDTLFQFLGMISQSGVYDAFNDIIDVFSNFVSSLDDSTLQNIANTVGDALSALLKPVKAVSEWIVKLANGFVTLVQNNSGLAKFVTLATALSGVILVVGGVALKFAGTLGYLTLMLKQLSTSFGTIGTVMKAGATKIVGALVPVTLALGVMYLVWKNDLFGIRTLVTSFVQNVVNSFKTAKTAVSGSLADMQNTLKTFDTQNSFFDGLTLAIMRVMVLFQALSEGWNDYTLSEDTFLKAKELGILPLIEAIFDLKYRFDNFKQGFIDGWNDISDKVKEFLLGLSEKVDGTIFEDLFDGLTEFLDKLSSNDAQAWYDFGFSFAEFTAKALAVIVVFRTLAKVFKTVSTVVSGLVKVFNGVVKVVEFFMGLPSKIAGIFSTIVGVVSKAVSDILGFLALVKEFGLSATLKGLFGTAQTIAAGIVSIIAGVILAVTNFVSMFKNGFNVIKEILMVVGIALAAVGAIILGAPALVAGIVAGIVALVATLVVVIKEHWQQICGFFSTIGSWIYTNVIQPVANFFVGLWNGIVTGVTTAINAVKTFLSTVASWIYNNVISPVVNFFMTYIFPYIEKIVEIVMKIIEIVTTLISVGIQYLVSLFTSIVQWINTNVVQPVIQFFTNLWNTIVTGVQTFVSNVTSFIGTIVSWISTNVITPIATFFTTLWNNVVSGVTSFISSVVSAFSSMITKIKAFFSPLVSFFQGVWNSIVNIFKTIGTAVSNAISGAVKGAINTVLSGAGGIINGFISAINAAISVINAIPGVSISKLTPMNIPQLATGGVVEKPTTALIGEAGTEAVMPLENNTEWIGVLANMLAKEMTEITPTNTTANNNASNGNTDNQYMTNNTTNNSTVGGDTDNSININEGAIQVTVQNASEEEALRLAKMIMEYIKRQKQLDQMLNYG